MFTTLLMRSVAFLPNPTVLVAIMGIGVVPSELCCQKILQFLNWRWWLMQLDHIVCVSCWLMISCKYLFDEFYYIFMHCYFHSEADGWSEVYLETESRWICMWFDSVVFFYIGYFCSICAPHPTPGVALTIHLFVCPNPLAQRWCIVLLWLLYCTHRKPHAGSQAHQSAWLCGHWKCQK